MASNQHDHKYGVSKQASLESIWKRKVHCIKIVKEIKPMRFLHHFEQMGPESTWKRAVEGVQMHGHGCEGALTGVHTRRI